MTKKEFELIARCIVALADKRGISPSNQFDDGYESARYAARIFADALAETNPRFDRIRFLKACGVYE